MSRDTSSDQPAAPLFLRRDLGRNTRISAEKVRGMADNSVPEQQEQQKQPKRGRGRPFEKGRSGNPAGRPRGAGKRASQAMQEVLDAETQALTRKAVEIGARR